MSSHFATSVAKTILGAVNMGSNRISDQGASWAVQYVAGWIDGSIDLVKEAGGAHGVSKQAFLIYMAKRGVPILGGPFTQDTRLLLIPAVALLGLSIMAAPAALTAGGTVAVLAGLDLFCNMYPVIVNGQAAYLDATRDWRVKSENEQRELRALIRQASSAQRAANAIRIHGPR